MARMISLVALTDRSLPDGRAVKKGETFEMPFDRDAVRLMSQRHAKRVPSRSQTYHTRQLTAEPQPPPLVFSEPAPEPAPIVTPEPVEIEQDQPKETLSESELPATGDQPEVRRTRRSYKRRDATAEQSPYEH